MHKPTTTEPVTKLNCPQCKKLITWSDDFPFRPFCCERCKLIDLGEWASEGHVIAGEPAVVQQDNPDDYD